MCNKCEQTTRRQFLALSSAGLVAAGIAGHGLMSKPAYASGKGTSMKPDEALAKLKEGNAKYVASPELCEAELGSRRAQTANGQAPWAAILSCADSRVTPELVFGGRNIGELFVCRNAGNIADFATIGTLEYGTEHLGVPLIVVMGHTKCGAVTAACDAALNGNKFSGALAQLVDVVLPVAKNLCADGKVTTNVIRASASQTAKSIISGSKVVENLVSEGKVKVVSAIYDIDTGMVEFDA
jgi:carbonic anhydrase